MTFTLGSIPVHQAEALTNHAAINGKTEIDGNLFADMFGTADKTGNAGGEAAMTLDKVDVGQLQGLIKSHKAEGKTSIDGDHFVTALGTKTTAEKVAAETPAAGKVADEKLIDGELATEEPAASKALLGTMKDKVGKYSSYALPALGYGAAGYGMYEGFKMLHGSSNELSTAMGSGAPVSSGGATGTTGASGTGEVNAVAAGNTSNPSSFAPTPDMLAAARTRISQG